MENSLVIAPEYRIVHGCIRYGQNPSLLVCGLLETPTGYKGFVAEVVVLQNGNMQWERQCVLAEPARQVQWRKEDENEWVYVSLKAVDHDAHVISLVPIRWPPPLSNSIETLVKGIPVVHDPDVQTEHSYRMVVARNSCFYYNPWFEAVYQKSLTTRSCRKLVGLLRAVHSIDVDPTHTTLYIQTENEQIQIDLSTIDKYDRPLTVTRTRIPSNLSRWMDTDERVIQLIPQGVVISWRQLDLTGTQTTRPYTMKVDPEELSSHLLTGNALDGSLFVLKYTDTTESILVRVSGLSIGFPQQQQEWLKQVQDLSMLPQTLWTMIVHYCIYPCCY